MEARQSKPRLIQAVIDAFNLPDLRGKILFTLAILILFRFIANVPVPGVDSGKLAELFSGAGSEFMDILDLFSGGALRKASIASLGVYPYITASIIMQLLVPVIPRLQALAKEGDSGREKINMYTHWLTVPLAALQGYGQMMLLHRSGIIEWSTLTVVTTVVSLVACTMLLVWLGERITERGIGNGISLIIFGGIVVSMPQTIWQAYDFGLGSLIRLILLSVAIITLIVFVTEAYRRIPVHYSRSVFHGRRMYRQSGSTYIPLRVNMAGMIPLIFGMALVSLPVTICAFFFPDNSVSKTIQDVMAYDSWLYWLLFFFLVVGFAFFYTIVIFEQQNLAETLQKQGGFIPGIRPGRHTAEYLDQVISRITWGGALFLGGIAVMPFFSKWIAGVPDPTYMILGSAGALISVGVALDTMRQLESQLLMRRYEGFLK